jgi:predicted metalloprotease
MSIENFKKILTFTNAEKELISSFDIPADTFLPLLLSLRDGGAGVYGNLSFTSGDEIDSIFILCMY